MVGTYRSPPCITCMGNLPASSVVRMLFIYHPCFLAFQYLLQKLGACVCVFVFQFSNWICLWFVCSMFVSSVKNMDTLDLGRFFFSLLLAKYSELANFFLSKWLKRCFFFWFSGHQISWHLFLKYSQISLLGSSIDAKSVKGTSIYLNFHIIICTRYREWSPKVPVNVWPSSHCIWIGSCAPMSLKILLNQFWYPINYSCRYLFRVFPGWVGF